MEVAVGTQSDGNISKAIVKQNLTKIRERLLELEDLYYIFRDEVEDSLQKVKYRLDKLAQLLGETENVS